MQRENNGRIQTEILLSRAARTESGQVVYRGGDNFADQSGLRFKDGKLTSGFSVNIDPLNNNIVNKGGAHILDHLPDGLRLVQRRTDPGHYELLPVNPNLSKDQYLNLVGQINLSPLNK